MNITIRVIDTLLNFLASEKTKTHKMSILPPLTLRKDHKNGVSHFQNLSNKVPSFDHNSINYKALKERAFNLRWATVPNGVLPLTAADPDFPVAPEISQAIQDYAKVGVFSYGPSEGLPSFKEAAAKVLLERKKVNCNANLILPIDGAASGMFTVARMVLSPGDEAIIFDPVDFLFQQSVSAAGGKVVRLPFNLKDNTFEKEQLEGLVTSRTKMICVCNPHNPLGRVFTAKELEIIGKVAVENKLWIMNDEIWSDIIYSGTTFNSIANVHPWVAERTITIHGFSKTFGLAGMRIGYIAAPNEKVYQQLVTASRVSSTAAGVTTLSQIAATVAYEKCWYWVDGFLEHLEKVKDYAVSRLNNMNGVHCKTPEGTYVLFINIESFGLSEEVMADYLMKKAKVAVVPGAAKWFGPSAKGHIRLCFSTSMVVVKAALDRIELALIKLRIKERSKMFDNQ